MGNTFSRKNRKEWSPDSEKSKKNSVSTINGSRKESVEATYATKIATNDLVSSSNGEANSTILAKAESSPKVTPEAAVKIPEPQPSEKSTIISKVESLTLTPSTEQVESIVSSVAMETTAAAATAVVESVKDTIVQSQVTTVECNVSTATVETKLDSQQAITQEQTSAKPADDSGSCKGDSQSKETSDTEKCVTLEQTEVTTQVPVAQETPTEVAPSPVESEAAPPAAEPEVPVKETQDDSKDQQGEGEVTASPVEETVAPKVESNEEKVEAIPSVVVDTVTSDISADTALVSETTERILEEVTAAGIKGAVELIQSCASQESSVIDDSGIISGDKSTESLITPPPSTEGEDEKKCTEGAISSPCEESQTDNVSSSVISSPTSQESSSIVESSPTSESVPEVTAKCDETPQVNANVVDESNNDTLPPPPPPSTDDKTKQLDNLNNNSNENSNALAVNASE